MITYIHHVQITVPKEFEAQARVFYCGFLNLQEIEKPALLKDRGGFWVKIGTQEVHISLEDGVNRHATKAHIAYQVDDLTYWRTKLNEQGIETLESIPIDHYDRFEFRDPFGNRIEFIKKL